MANYTRDDYGRSVIAVGAPNSIERTKVEHPRKIEWANSVVWMSAGERPMLHKALLAEEISSHFDVDRITANLIAECSDFDFVDGKIKAGEL